MLGREGQVAQHVRFGLIQQGGQAWEARPEAVRYLAPLLMRCGRVRLGKGRPNRGGDHGRGRFWHMGEGIPHEVHPAPLPARPLQHRSDGALQAFMGIADDQLHPNQAACDQPTQELEPESAVLARSHVQPEHLPLARGPHGNGDHHRQGHHASFPAHFQEGRIEPKIRIGPFQPARAKPLYLDVQLLAQPAHLALADARYPQGLHQIIHPPRRDALHVGLLNHGHQRPLGTLARLQQAGEVAAIPCSGHPQLDGAHAGVPGPLPVAIALACPARRAFMSLGGQVLAELELHERLAQHPHAVTQEVSVPLKLCLAQQLQKCHPQLIGHRVVPPFGDFVHPDENHTVAVLVNDCCFYTLPGTLPQWRSVPASA